MPWTASNPRITGVDTVPHRWRVARHTIEESGKQRHTWTVMNTRLWSYRHFPTWRDALDYADHKARTHEVVLPRVKRGDHVVAGKGVYSLHVDYREHCTDITLGGWDGITVENSHLWDLTLYLAACAQHWKDNQ